MSSLQPALLRSSVLASCIAVDFILAGNAITQSFMTLPCLIIDFPPPSSPDYARRAHLLGLEWPLCWRVGNNFFRPISTLATIGYAYTAWSLSQSSPQEQRHWKWFALNALLHVSVILHSAINMQPLNDKLAALAGAGTDGSGVAKVAKGDEGRAVQIATSWIRGNYYRILIPTVSGAVSLYRMMFA